MKKLSLVIALCAFVAFTSSAQKFQLGVKGGLNFPSKDAFGFDGDGISASGWHAGVFGLLKVSKFGVQPELLYSSFVFSDDDVDVDTDLNYLTVPIIGKFYLVQGINVQAGPQFGFLLNSETEGGGLTIDNSDALKGSDLSIAVGAGADLPFGLQVSARYLIGVSDINDVSGATESINTSTFQVSLGYALVKLGL